MNKIILKGLVACVIVSYTLTGDATESPSATLKRLLGDYADFKPVVSTPVKTTGRKGDIIDPEFKTAVSSLRKKQDNLVKLKEKADTLASELERAEANIESLMIQLTEKDVEIAMLKEKIEEQNKLIKDMDAWMSDYFDWYYSVGESEE